ncbi:selenide, water dikinase SelD [Myxacorys almedinensis]|uniref:Selenide, water dikinase SelD n=1 Tax=Myxacorys almedinensis A TaxID=2690445 RepID=A0A8J7YWP9_9CYAN|nr:selenide, water dikinase SelD [Myxacorys almedinensis]NDJ16047.1 selenide, water dikinase SelD [Myxacorys almedinensis A]
MNSSTHPISKDLVLVGGGHSHAIALRTLAMHPLPGVRITLISDPSDTPYSGMLPGHVAGFYAHEECHINLRSLCQAAQVTLICDRAIGLDLATNRVQCINHPAIAFDIVSIDIGSTPILPPAFPLSKHHVGAKPIPAFLEWWYHLCENVPSSLNLGIVGGGTGGVELALNMNHRLEEVLRHQERYQERSEQHFTIHLFHRGQQLLPNHNRWVQRHFQHLLRDRNIQLYLGETVEGIAEGAIFCASGLTVPCDETVWVTGAAAPRWIAQSGLTVDADGFILVNDALQSVSHSQVFAAGDIATMSHYSRPKAGVFAVRQGKPLVENLQNALRGRSLKPYRPQKNYLSLIGTGDDSAVASYGILGLHGRWLWTLKDQIDRAFMNRFTTLAETMTPDDAIHPSSPASPISMRCLGCGAKIGSSILERVLQRIRDELPNAKREDILLGLDDPDDAAVVQIPSGNVMVQTIDYFPALVSDPFLFGQISTNHSLSDVFAMGATPQSALAIATLPYATEPKQEETLYQLLSGAVKTLHQAQAVLIGGHTIEGETLAFGLACNGVARPDRLLRKNGLHPGQVLILTKPIGTGTLFAAEMRHKAKARWIDGAIASMISSNQHAATCFLHHGATACTDITGFGLLGHLVEMVKASRVAIALQLEAVPMLEGAQDCIQQGIFSSLYPQNLRASQWVANDSALRSHPLFPLLFDPQTSGGLLASVPSAQVDACLAALKAAGYCHSTAIGSVYPKQDGVEAVTIS